MDTPRFTATSEVHDKIVTLGDSEDLMCIEEFDDIIKVINRAEDAIDVALIESFRYRKYFYVIKYTSDNRVVVYQRGCSTILIDIKF
jgi:molybdopterin-guanine dinucleotide biosynthesis protein